MSNLFLATDLECLAERLAQEIDEQVRDEHGPFVPVTIAVPNLFIGRWLRLFLARKFGVLVNVTINANLEEVLWRLLIALDSRDHRTPPEPLNEDDYRLLVLAALWGDGSPRLGSLNLPSENSGQERHYCRRAWQRAGLLSALIRDYEYHRQDGLIQKWLKNKPKEGAPNSEPVNLEKDQQTLFQLIIEESNGYRTRLSKFREKSYKTLPQYACEVMELAAKELRPAPPYAGRVHLFAMGQISTLHIQAIAWLGARCNLKVYHVNPLLSRAAVAFEKGKNVAKEVSHWISDFWSAQFPESGKPDDAGRLLRNWGRASAEALGLWTRLLEKDPSFICERLESPRRITPSTILGMTQERLVFSESKPIRVLQDRSVQVLPCPGVFREVETVYHSIAANLQSDATLMQADIGVMAADLDRYRPVIQAVFDREPAFFSYNLARYGAGDLSPYGQAIVGLLDLALESFTRSKVLEVIMNPCYLAALGMEPEQARSWGPWAEALGIFHGWNGAEKVQQGISGSSLFSWQHGMQRLRLARIMEAERDDLSAPLAQFESVAPYEDPGSADEDSLELFVQAVDRLLPRILKWRHRKATASEWTALIRELAEEFLAIPADRPEEAVVRDKCFAGLERFKSLDGLLSSSTHEKIPLALVREAIHDSLMSLSGRRGEPLAGVTVGSLAHLATVPFRIVYVLGLNEETFPGSNRLSSLDLRWSQRTPGDVRPAEANTGLFLQAFLSAHDKIYLSYDCHELQKDQHLNPSPSLNQLVHFVENAVLAPENNATKPTFSKAEIPLCSSDPRYLQETPGESASDAVVNFSRSDRLLALIEGSNEGTLALSAEQKELLDREEARCVPHVEAPPAALGRAGPVSVSIKHLADFLKFPAQASIARHLRLFDDEESEPVDDEPFVTEWPNSIDLLSIVVNRFIKQTVVAQKDKKQAIPWENILLEVHEEFRLLGKAPEQAFAQVDADRFKQILKPRLEGTASLKEFLEQRKEAEYFERVAFGEGSTAGITFPPLSFPQNEASKSECGGPIIVTGSIPHVWRSAKALDVLVVTNKSKFKEEQAIIQFLEPLLFLFEVRLGKESPKWGGPAAAKWLGNRSIHFHLPDNEKIHSREILLDKLSDDQIHNYLSDLASDLVNPLSCDYLPLEVIVKDEELRQGYEGELKKEADPSAYAQLVQDALDSEDEEDERYQHRRRDYMELIEAEAPADALTKIHKRFHILHQVIPAQEGDKPKEPRPKKGAKKS